MAPRFDQPIEPMTLGNMRKLGVWKEQPPRESLTGVQWRGRAKIFTALPFRQRTVRILALSHSAGLWNVRELLCEAAV
jgi:hypothetical protein